MRREKIKERMRWRLGDCERKAGQGGRGRVYVRERKLISYTVLFVANTKTPKKKKIKIFKTVFVQGGRS